MTLKSFNQNSWVKNPINRSKIIFELILKDDFEVQNDSIESDIEIRLEWRNPLLVKHTCNNQLISEGNCQVSCGKFYTIRG